MRLSPLGGQDSTPAGTGGHPTFLSMSVFDPDECPDSVADLGDGEEIAPALEDLA